MVDEGALRRMVKGVLLLLAFVVQGCSAAMRPPLAPAPPPQPLSPVEIAAFTALLEVEERRELFIPLIEQSAAAAEPSIRKRAALAIGRIGAAAGRPFIRQMVADPDTGVAATAVFAAGLLRDTASVDLLISLLDAPVANAAPTVAGEAAWALGQIGTRAAQRSLFSYLLTADTAVASGEHAGLQRSVLSAAVASGTADAPALLRWLASPDSETRQLAVRGLARIPSTRTTPRLSALLSDPAAAVRAAALGGLSASSANAGSIPPNELLPELLPLLADTAYVVRIAAIRAVSTYSLPTVVAHLLPIAEAGAPHERLAAIEGLASMERVAAGALVPLATIARDRTEPESLRAAALSAAASIDVLYSDRLIEDMATDPEWRVRAAAAQILARLGPDAFPRIQRLARDPDPRVARVTLTGAVAARDGEDLDRLRPLLIEAALHPDVGVRAAGLGGLERLADLTLFPLLLDAYQAALRDIQNEAQLAAIDAIAALRNAGIAAPERAFFARFPRSDDYRVRQRAIERFGAIAVQRWGEAFPLEPTGTLRPYRLLVDQWIAPANREDLRPKLSMLTEEGEVEIELFSDQATLATSNLLLLASTGYFDGRDVGDLSPASILEIGAADDDLGVGVGYSLRQEVSRLEPRGRTVGVGLHGPLASSGDIFIALDDRLDLYGQVGIVGRVTRGEEVLQRLLPGQRIISLRERVEEE